MKNIGNIAWICGAAALVLAVTGLFWCLDSMEKKSSTSLVIGTYGEHLYRYLFDSKTHKFTLSGTAAAINPSYVLSSGEGEIFAVSETGGNSGVYSFDEQEDGVIGLTADLRQSGDDPCFILIYQDDAGNRHMLTADYSGGSISVFPIVNGVLKDRSLQMAFEGNGPVVDRQEVSHIHQLKVLPNIAGCQDDYILASDLGADVIRLIKVNSDVNGIDLSHISDVACPSGSGPRHMEFSADGRFLYCITELSGDVLVYGISYEDGEPQFDMIQQIQADEVYAGGSADIHIHPSGKWIYTSHRLDNDGIAVFTIKADGTLEKSSYTRTGKHPRNFMITSDGEFLLVACRDDMVIQVFKIGEDGSLIPTSTQLHFKQDKPSSILSSHYTQKKEALRLPFLR